MQALTFAPDSTDRMLYIAAFAVSGYASTAGRTNKPFNPLLGETYELVYPEKVCQITCCAVLSCRYKCQWNHSLHSVSTPYRA